MDIAPDHHRRREGAVPEAIDLFESEPSVLRRLAELYLELPLERLERLPAVHGDAGIAQAEANDVPSRGLGAKVMIERQHPADVRVTDAERRGDERHDVRI